MKRGKSIFSWVSAAGSPALKPRGSEQTHRWDLLYQTKSAKCSKWTTPGGPRRAPLSPLTASECVPCCCSCFLLLCHSVFNGADFLRLMPGEKGQSGFHRKQVSGNYLFYKNFETHLCWLNWNGIGDLDYWTIEVQNKSSRNQIRHEAEERRTKSKMWVAGFLDSNS